MEGSTGTGNAPISAHHLHTDSIKKWEHPPSSIEVSEQRDRDTSNVQRPDRVTRSYRFSRPSHSVIPVFQTESLGHTGLENVAHQERNLEAPTRNLRPRYPHGMGALYRSLASTLGTRIYDGEFAVGSSLPSELALAAEFGVSRGTVRLALALLERKGIVQPIRGRGWVIRPGTPTQAFTQLMGFAQWARSRGMSFGGTILVREPSHPTEAEARDLRLSTRDDGMRVVRVRTLEGRRVMLERSYFPGWVSRHVAEFPDDVPSIVGALEENGLSVSQGRHLIDAVAANSRDAKWLAIRRSSPLLRVRHVAITNDGRPLWSNDDRYVPGTISFDVLAASQVSSVEAP